MHDTLTSNQTEFKRSRRDSLLLGLSCKPPGPFYSMPQYVYFIHAVGTNIYKVGISVHPAKRTRDMQVGSPLHLELTAKVACQNAREAEGRVHRAINLSRVQGEWFDLSLDEYTGIIDELRKYAAGKSSLLDTLEMDYGIRNIVLREHRRKGTRWVEYTCSVCGITKVAGDESQSAKSRVCYDCWRKDNRKARAMARSVSRNRK